MGRSIDNQSPLLKSPSSIPTPSSTGLAVDGLSGVSGMLSALKGTAGYQTVVNITSPGVLEFFGAYFSTYSTGTPNLRATIDGTAITFSLTANATTEGAVVVGAYENNQGIALASIPFKTCLLEADCGDNSNILACYYKYYLTG